MFWGLIMEPNKRYSQTVENAFHVSMASLDLSTADDEVVQVILCYGDRNYLLCSLKKGSTWQVPLDLNFQEGTKIAFTCNGQGYVHLTGYLIMDEDSNEFNKYIDQFDELENEQDEEEEINKKLSKRKAAESPKQGKELKRLKQQEITESSDDDDDDCEEDGVDEDDTEDSENEDDEDDSDEDEEDEDEEDEEDEEEEDNEKQQQKKPMKPKPQQLQEKKKKQVQEQPQQQLQQSKKKHDKQKLTNGKEVKQDQQSKQDKKNKAEQKQSHQQNAQNEGKKRFLTGGILVEDKKIGNGAVAQQGKFIAVYNIGRLKNGKKFDSTLDGEGFKFRLGKGEVIKGWDIGIAGMKVGGKRRITIPPNMAYGAQGSPPLIPGNSTLIFDVELRKVY